MVCLLLTTEEHVFKSVAFLARPWQAEPNTPPPRIVWMCWGFTVRSRWPKLGKRWIGLQPGSVLEVLADDPETLHDMPLLIGRSPHNLVVVHQDRGEFRFLIEVIA